MDSRKKDNKGNRRLTVHVRLKPAHLITPLGHHGLQALDLFLALLALPGHLDLQAPDLFLTDLRCGVKREANRLPRSPRLPCHVTSPL